MPKIYSRWWCIPNIYYEKNFCLLLAVHHLLMKELRMNHGHKFYRVRVPATQQQQQQQLGMMRQTSAVGRRCRPDRRVDNCLLTCAMPGTNIVTAQRPSTVQRSALVGKLLGRQSLLLKGGMRQTASGLGRNVNWGRPPPLPPPSPPLPLSTRVRGYNPRNFFEIKGARR